MWYAIIFISFMNVQVLDIDITQEYSSRKECSEKTREELIELLEAISEQLNAVEKKTQKVTVKYKCKKLPFRKT